MQAKSAQIEEISEEKPEDESSHAFMALPKKIEKVIKQTFIFDSGASDHILSNREVLH